MMKGTLALSALLLIAGAFAIGRGSHTQPTAQTWEYKIESKCSDDKKLNALGAEGWELVGFTTTDAGITTTWRCIFKRPEGLANAPRRQ